MIRSSSEQLALISLDRSWTYAELEREIRAWAARFAALGVGRGDRVVVVSHNRPELVAAFHACGRLGAVWIPLNARLTDAELQALIQRVRPKLVLVDDASRVRADGARTLAELDASQISAQAVSRFGPDDVSDSASPHEVRAVLFTSGTTGVPKGAELTFANFDAIAAANAERLGGGSDQRWLCCMPLFHIGGLAMVHRCASYGATLILHPRFDVESVVRAVEEDGITHLSVVATGLKWLLEAGLQPHQLRAVLVGGGPVSADLLREARLRGLPVVQTYGLTEACSQVATELPASADGTSAGMPLRGVQVRVVDEEIQVRGATVMRGYLDDPRATAQAFTSDGWLKTGDLGTLLPDGRLRVLSRRTDLIVTGGENVYPAEVEAVLAAHPSVAEAAVTAVDDELWGQIPAALIVPRGETGELDFRYPEATAALTAWCRGRLAGFKVPKRFVTAAALPKTGSGKVDRAQVRSLLLQAVGTDRDVQGLSKQVTT